MRISDWSSDVCSSDLRLHDMGGKHGAQDAFAIARKGDAAQPIVGIEAAARNRGVSDSAWMLAGKSSGGGGGDDMAVQVERDAADRVMGFGIFGGQPIACDHLARVAEIDRSEEHTSELQSLMRISYAVFCLKKKKTKHDKT